MKITDATVSSARSFKRPNLSSRNVMSFRADQTTGVDQDDSIISDSRDRGHHQAKRARLIS